MKVTVEKIYEIDEEKDTQTIMFVKKSTVKHPVLGNTMNKEFYFMSVEPGSSKAEVGQEIDLSKVEFKVRQAEWKNDDDLVQVSNWISLV